VTRCVTAAVVDLKSEPEGAVAGTTLRLVMVCVEEIPSGDHTVRVQTTGKSRSQVGAKKPWREGREKEPRV